MSLLENNTDQDNYCRIYRRPASFAFPTNDIAALELAVIQTSDSSIILPKRSKAANFCTAIWCESGSLKMESQGWTQTVKSGQVGILDTGTYVNISAGTDGTKAYYLLMDGPLSEQLLKHVGLWQGVFSYRAIPLDWLERIALRISNPELQVSMAHTGYSMFKNVTEQAQELCPVPELWRAETYFQHNWNKHQTNVEALLSESGISRTKLTNLFRAHLNTTPLQYLNQVRVTHAQRLLMQTQASIADIACGCGLPDASYFSHWFCKHTGSSPSTLRKA